VSDLICPKCHGTMRSYERGGVVVDQCNDCRGLFLDRGELERLIDAESTWDGRRSDNESNSSSRPQNYDRGSGDEYGRSSRDDYGRQQGRPPKKRRSFLEELFD